MNSSHEAREVHEGGKGNLVFPAVSPKGVTHLSPGHRPGKLPNIPPSPGWATQFVAPGNRLATGRSEVNYSDLVQSGLRGIQPLRIRSVWSALRQLTTTHTMVTPFQKNGWLRIMVHSTSTKLKVRPSCGALIKACCTTSSIRTGQRHSLTRNT